MTPTPYVAGIFLPMKAMALLLGCAFPLLLRSAEPLPGERPRDMRQLLQQGLFEEEASRDYEKAAGAYSALVAEYDRQRALAATALFRLAEVRAKQGNKAEAITLHQRLLAEFPNHDPLAKHSRERLAALGAPDAAKPGALDPTYTGRLQNDLAALRVELASLIQTYTPRHPKMVQLREKIRAIEELLNPPPPVALTGEETKELVRVREMAKNSPDLLDAVNREENPQTTPLTRAAMKGWTEVVTFLLDQGADVNGATGSEVPLLHAAGKGHKKVVELLLARGAEINRRDRLGDTALIHGCANGRLEIARLLLDRGADPKLANNVGRTPLNAACWAKSTEIARLLLEKGADPNLLSGWAPGGRGSEEGTPLLQAIGWDLVELATLLLEKGADPNLPHPSGVPPLAVAVRKSTDVFAKLLLTRGAKPDLADSNGNTAMHLAAREGRPGMVTLLLEHGASPESLNKDGETPLLDSITHGVPVFARRTDGPNQGNSRDERVSTEEMKPFLSIWEPLLGKGAEINRANGDGRTALHLVIADTRIPEEAGVWLADRGADLTIKDKEGRTPIQAAPTGARRLFFEKRYVFPQLTKERVITHFDRFSNHVSEPTRIASVAEFEGPPSLRELLRENFARHLAASVRHEPDTWDLAVYRADEDKSVREVARASVAKEAGTGLLTFGGIADPDKWPALRWGDVVTFEDRPETTATNAQRRRRVINTSAGDASQEALLPAKSRKITLQVGEPLQEIELSETRLQQWSSGFGGDGRPVLVHRPAGAQPEPNVWNPGKPLPKWTFSELIARAVAAEPRAQLEAVKVQRTVDGKLQEWSVDMRADNGVRDLPARIGDGDRIVIPLRPATDPEALARRRTGIFQAAPGRVLGQRVFAWKEQDPGPRTLGEFLMQSYLAGEMVVPLPDLSKIAIHRLKGDVAEEETVTVDLAKAISEVRSSTLPASARASDVPLQWGDVVELRPAAGDATNWTGFSTEEVLFLTKALTRTASMAVHGASAQSISEVMHAPEFARFSRAGTVRENPLGPAPFDLVSFVEPKAALSTVIRVKLRSGDSVREFTRDQLQEVRPWVRDGDKIEVERL